MAWGWEGDKVRLVPLDRERHFANALKWLNDPEVTARLDTGDWPITRGAEQSFFDHAEQPSTSDVHFAVESLQGEHVGFTALHRISLRDRTAVTGLFIGRRDLWGQGLGNDAVRVRTRYAFEALNLRLLLSEVMADNQASLAMLLRAGYEEVGRIRDRYFKRGAYRDQVLLALWRTD